MNSRRAAGYLRAAACSVSICLVALSALDLSAAESGILRTGCLAGIQVEYPGGDRSRDASVDIFFSFYRYAYRRENKFPDYDVAWGAVNNMYLLFKAKCDRRNELSRDLIRSYRAAFPGGAKLSLIENVAGPTGKYRKLIFIPGKPKFRRDDCVVKIDVKIDYQSVSGQNSATLRLRVLDSVLRYGIENFPETARYNVLWDNDGDLHLHFYDKCDRKLQMAERIAAAVNTRFAGIVAFSVSGKSASRRDMLSTTYGPYWIDGHATIRIR